MDKVILCNEAEELAPLPFNESDVASDFSPFPLLPSQSIRETVEHDPDPRKFDPSVYEDLPEPLPRAMKCSKNEDDKMVLLIGSLTALSSTMTEKVCFCYQKWYRPNLFAFIASESGNGKGRTSLISKLVEEIHQEKTRQTRMEIEKYKKSLDAWNRSGHKSGTPPERPKIKLLNYPANSTAAALENLISDNSGNGFLFTAEVAVIMSILFTEHGNYISSLLSSAENEPLSRARRSDFELVEVPQTRFSVLIAGTLEHISRLLGDGSDGLQSRFIYIFLGKGPLWQTQWKWNNEESDEDIFSQLGKDYKKLYDKLCNSDGTEFMLSDNQKKRFDAKFEDLSETYVKIYQDKILASVRRMAVIALRLMCVLTVLRELNKPGDLPLKVMCSEGDFERVLKMVETLLVHSGYSLSLLSEPSKKYNYSFKGWEKLINALPDKFQRCEAIKTGNRLGIKNQRIDKYLHRLCEEGKITKLEFGIYQKVK